MGSMANRRKLGGNRQGVQNRDSRKKVYREDEQMKYIIEAWLLDDEDKEIFIHEEYNDRRMFDIRYTQLTENFDEEIKTYMGQA
jgi:hypothetical protein